MNDLKKLAEDITASYDARVQVVKEIADDTQNMLTGFREQREEVSSELREGLARSENLRKKDFDKMMNDILLAQAERENSVRQMLQDFRQEEEAVSGMLRKLRDKGEKIRIKDFKKILFRIKEEQERRQKEISDKTLRALGGMKKEVSEMLENFREERAGALSEWKNIISSLAKTKNQRDEVK